MVALLGTGASAAADPAAAEALRTGVEAAVRAQQNNDTAAELGWAAARVLERVITSVRDGGRGQAVTGEEPRQGGEGLLRPMA